VKLKLVLAAFSLALLSACGADEGAPDVPAKPPVDRAGHERMVALLAELRDDAAASHPYFGSGRLEQLQREVELAGDDAGWHLLLDTATELLRHGDERPAIALLKRAHDGLASGAIEGDEAAFLGVTFHLGTAWLRLAETENCCAKPTAESCIVPITGTGIHEHQEGAEQSIRYLSEVLKLTAPEDYWHYCARWLLNVAYMAMGHWPDGVPADERLPREAFADDSGLPKFRSVSDKLGLDTNGTAGGVVVEDFDGDERLDVAVSSWGPRGHLRVFHNCGDGSFEDRTERAGLTGITGGLNMLGADYDSDGDVDILVLRGGWCYEHGRFPCSLLQNQGDGTFVDVTFDAGLGDRREPTQTAAFADYDLDGDLDVYIGAESSDRMPCHGHLYQNDGDGHFVDVAARAGVQNDRYCKAVVFGDYDNDRYPDLFVSNIGEPNRLYHNEHDGTFRDVTERAGVAEPLISFPAWFWDFDNDGRLDLFVSEYHVGIAHVASELTRGTLPFGHARLLLGGGNGEFEDVSDRAGVSRPMMPMGCNFGDLDNDGWLDCYLGTGDPEYFSLMPNLMLRNDRGRRLVDVTMSGGFGHLQKGHGIAFADFDHDGDTDVFAVMGGAYPGDAYRDALFENPGVSGHWLTLRLVGTQSARCAIGARVHVVVREGDVERDIYRCIGTGASFGSNPLRQTIGLGAADELVSVDVRWPRLSPPEVFEGLAMDAAFTVTEGTHRAVSLALPKAPLRRE